MNCSDVQRSALVALQREIDCAVALLRVLQREYLVLTRRPNNDLETIINEKQRALETLDEAGRVRDQALRLAEFSGSADARGTAQGDFLKTRAVLAELWEKLYDVAQELQNQNEVNGHVIELRRSHCEQAFAVLQGQGPGLELYHPKAKIKRMYQSHLRSLGKA